VGEHHRDPLVHQYRLIQLRCGSNIEYLDCGVVCVSDPAAGSVQAGKYYKCFGPTCQLISRVFPLGEFREYNCNDTCGKPPPQPPLPPPAPPSPPKPPPPPALDPHSLNATDPTAICLDGTSPDIFVYLNPKPSKQWVILLGTTSVGLDICISERACALYGKQPHVGPPGPPSPPPPAPSPEPLAQGPQSRDCTRNPDWCTANHASIPLCDFTLGLSNKEDIVSASGCPIAGTCCAKPTMAFRGRRILAAAIKRLATLGMSGAEEVLLTGVGFGGTSAILNADFFAEQLKLVVRSLKVFKVLPVDAIHPKDPPTFAGGPLPWLGQALRNLDSLANLTATSSHPACVANNSADPSVCLYPAVALTYVTTPIFLVQEFPSVWDTQCLFDGAPTSSILQLECSSRSSMYNCAQ
jgi:hypothetical protein